MTSTKLLNIGAVLLVLGVLAWVALSVVPGGSAAFALIAVLSVALLVVGVVLMACGGIAKLVAMGVREGKG